MLPVPPHASANNRWRAGSCTGSRSLGCCWAIALFAVIAAASHLAAQSATTDPFNGTWRLSVAKSNAAWQAHPQPKRPAPEPLSHGVITIKVTGSAMDYQVEHGTGTGQPRKASVAASFNDATWQAMQGAPEGGFSTATLVKINERQHYWVTRGADGNFAGLMLRRLADDGRSLTAVGIGPDGYVQYVRVFDKQ